MKTDDVLLLEIVEGCNAIGGYLSGKSESDFHSEPLLKDGVLMRLIVVGEAAYRISEETRRKTPEIPWPKIAAVRHIAVHEYFGVNWEIVWSLASERVPQLHAMVRESLKQLYPDTAEKYLPED